MSREGRIRFFRRETSLKILREMTRVDCISADCRFIQMHSSHHLHQFEIGVSGREVGVEGEQKTVSTHKNLYGFIEYIQYCNMVS